MKFLLLNILITGLICAGLSAQKEERIIGPYNK